MEQLKDQVLPIIGKVQQYAWGGFDFLPSLLKISKKKGEPYAEFWLGTHGRGIAELQVSSDKTVNLKNYIESFPELTLGEQASRIFGRLPYLLKILDVRDMLSIQVHPNKIAAKKAFQDENNKGIHPDAPERNYKDDNHKPELMLALGDFWLLHGFKSKEDLKKILSAVPELGFLIPVFGEGNYKALYQKTMELTQSEVDSHLTPLVNRIIPLYKEGKLSKSSEDFWAARAALTYSQNGSVDRGIFSVYFFNLIKLKNGEAVFQDAGLPHAYLEGQNVEIMANSDNVLRGGLTPKHVDVPELLKHIRFEATIPQIMRGDLVGEAQIVYRTTAPDFELSRFNLRKNEILELKSLSTEIFFLLEGSVELSEHGRTGFQRSVGEAWISFDGAEMKLKAQENSVFVQACIPGIA